LAAYTEIYIEQYADFSTKINLSDDQGDSMNLVGYSASSQMRKSYYSSSAETFDVNFTNASTGEIEVRMSAANTANVSPGRYMFDVVIVDPTSKHTRVVEGIVNVLAGVTR
jgi:hypothetical protein